MKIRRQDAQPLEAWTEMFGGTGTVINSHFWKEDELASPVRICCWVNVPPDGSIGQHRHEEEEEILVVMGGEGTVIPEEGDAVTVSAGDTVLTGPGEGHTIAAGPKGLSLLALIVKTKIED